MKKPKGLRFVPCEKVRSFKPKKSVRAAWSDAHLLVGQLPSAPSSVRSAGALTPMDDEAALQAFVAQSDIGVPLKRERPR